MAAVDVFIGQDTIAARVREMAAEIRRDAGDGTPVHFIGVLKGSFMFFADLMRAMDGPVTCDFIACASYVGKTSSGEVKLTKDLDFGLEGRYAVIIEDIVDTGVTLSYMHEILHARSPKALRTACLLSKPSRRKKDVPVEFTGFTIEDKFVVGYGLDYNEQYRNLSYIGVMSGE